MNDDNYFKQHIRDVPDFPKKGIIFKDITPLLGDASAFRRAIQKMSHRFINEKINTVACVEARGFLIGSAIAYNLGAGLVPVRKIGKLPCETNDACYGLEYGNDTLEIHKDAIAPGQSVLLVDDVLATGGTAAAKAELVKKQGGIVFGPAFFIELKFLIIDVWLIYNC